EGDGVPAGGVEVEAGVVDGGGHVRVPVPRDIPVSARSVDPTADRRRAQDVVVGDDGKMVGDGGQQAQDRRAIAQVAQRGVAAAVDASAEARGRVVAERLVRAGDQLQPRLINDIGADQLHVDALGQIGGGVGLLAVDV